MYADYCSLPLAEFLKEYNIEKSSCQYDRSSSFLYKEVWKGLLSALQINKFYAMYFCNDKINYFRSARKW